MNEERIDWDKRIGLPDGITLEKDKAKVKEFSSKPDVSGQVCDHHYVPIGCYEQNGRFICTKCKNEI